MSAQSSQPLNPRRGLDRAEADPQRPERLERVRLYQERIDAIKQRRGLRKMTDSEAHTADVEGVTIFAAAPPPRWRSVREIVLEHLTEHGPARLAELLDLMRWARPQTTWTKEGLRQVLLALVENHHLDYLTGGEFASPEGSKAR